MLSRDDRRPRLRDALAKGRARGARGRALASLLALLSSLSLARAAHAHPGGPSSVNRYFGAELADDHVRLAYMLDYGELPAASELDRLDRDGDGAVTPAERDAYLDAWLPAVQSHWTVELDGAPVVPRVAFRALEAPPGENGLSTLRITLELSVPRPAARPGTDLVLRLRDTTAAERSGWREIRADDSAAGTVVARTPPAEPPRADRVPRVDDATFTFRPTPAPSAPALATPAPARHRARWLLLAPLVPFALALLLLFFAWRRRARGR